MVITLRRTTVTHCVLLFLHFVVVNVFLILLLIVVVVLRRSVRILSTRCFLSESSDHVNTINDGISRRRHGSSPSVECAERGGTYDNHCQPCQVTTM